MLATLLAALTLQAGAAPVCTDEQLRALTAPADEASAPFRLTCSATLTSGSQIQHRLLIEGSEASGLSLDCGGGSIGVSGRASDTRIPTVAIQSRPDRTATQVVWSVPHDIVLANCTIHGNLRIWGVGAGGDLDALRTSSRQEGHTARLQAAAPTRIALTNLHLVGTGSIPLYVGPGVTSVAMLGGRVTGRSVSTAVYLDAESAGNTIRGVAFDIATGREQIAIDGSARNRIEANRFALRGRGGVFLYRNCGEDGVIRHQPPSDNIVSNNSFQGAAWFQPRTVLVGAREGRRRYCGDDAGWPFGSSLDDGDNATGNVVSGNTSRYRWLPDWITGWLQAGRGAVSAP